MINEFALVCIGILIGTLVPFLAAWVSFDRSVHELTLEARTMRDESAELRRLAGDLARLLDRLGETGRATSLEPVDPRARSAAPVDESIYSVAVERELTGRERVQALIQPSYFQGR